MTPTDLPMYLPTYLTAVSTIDPAPVLLAGVLLAGSAVALWFYKAGLDAAYAEGHLEGLDSGLSLSDTRGAYLDGFNDGLDTTDERDAYLDGFEDGNEVR